MTAQIIRPLIIEPDTTPVRRMGYRMALKQWRERWAKAKAENDYERMDRLDREYEILGCY